MKSVYDISVREELCARIAHLTETSRPQWGKMNVSQMIKHCILWNEMALGKTEYRQVFIGRLFGKMALRSMIKDERPVRRNMGTLPELIVSDSGGDIEFLKKHWMTTIKEYGHLPNDYKFVHTFFGKVDRQQTGLLAYKHTDHHLRQFGA